MDDANLVKSTGTSRRFGADEVGIKEKRLLTKMHDRRSLDSTITESTMTGCCSQAENEITLIRKHLLEIENKQSSLMDMIKEFTTSVMDGVSVVQMKVSNLELIVEKMAQELAHGGRYSDALSAKYLKRSPSIASPMLSTCTPRTSIDGSKQSTLLPTKHVGVWEDTYTRSRTKGFGNKTLTCGLMPPESQASSLGNVTPASFCREIHEEQIRKNGVFDPAPLAKARVNKLDAKNNPWKIVKDYLCYGDLDSAYAEVLSSCNEQLLFDLLDRTGPALEILSKITASNLLGLLASYLVEQRYVNSIIPWLQQLVDLSNIHGPTYLALSAKAKQEFFYGVQEAAKLDIFKLAERRCLTEMGRTLCQFWG